MAADLVVAAAEEAVVVAVPHQVRKRLALRALRVLLALQVVAEEAAELPD